MKEELVKELGERLKNGEDLLTIKADFTSRGEAFNEFENFSKNNSKLTFNFISLIQKWIISFVFIFGLTTLVYNILGIPKVLSYLIIFIIIFFIYYNYLKKYILEFAFDLNKYVRMILLFIILILLYKYNPSFTTSISDSEAGFLNQVNTN